MKPHVIALYSPAPQSGKSTFSEQALLKGYMGVPFARPLKRTLLVLLSSVYGHHTARRLVFSGAGKEEILTEFGGNTPRQLLQSLGTTWGRNCVDQNLWVNLWKLQVKRFLDIGASVVVDDMRFPNEFQAVKDLGGTCIRIVRPSAPQVIHETEGQLEQHRFTGTLINHMDLPGWEDYCKETIEYIRTLY